jgi:hypothetical protein
MGVGQALSSTKLIATVSLAVAVFTMITSNQLSIYASPTTEDDGWTEGDYEGTESEQEQQAQDDWEDAGRPGDNDDDDNDDDNSNSDNIPECKRDVLQECKLSGNTGLLCGVEDLMQGDYNPNVIGDGHACHDVYIGTYNQLEACKDGTYAVSCGSIGVLPGIP